MWEYRELKGLGKLPTENSKLIDTPMPRQIQFNRVPLPEPLNKVFCFSNMAFPVVVPHFSYPDRVPCEEGLTEKLLCKL